VIAGLTSSLLPNYQFKTNAGSYVTSIGGRIVEGVERR
jgi:hypothetical protein